MFELLKFVNKSMTISDQSLLKIVEQSSHYVRLIKKYGDDVEFRLPEFFKNCFNQLRAPLSRRG